MPLMQLIIVLVVVGVIMLWTIVVILILLWPLGLTSSYTMVGFIPVLLVIAVIVVLLNNIKGRRVYSHPEVISPQNDTRKGKKNENIHLAGHHSARLIMKGERNVSTIRRLL